MAFENVQVCVRCRPLNTNEIRKNYRTIVDVNESSSVVKIKQINMKNESFISFNFDYVFGFQSKQSDIYTLIAKPLVHRFFDGYNGMYFLKKYYGIFL